MGGVAGMRSRRQLPMISCSLSSGRPGLTWFDLVPPLPPVEKLRAYYAVPSRDAFTGLSGDDRLLFWRVDQAGGCGAGWGLLSRCGEDPACAG